jgi:hypothetical protein
MNNQTLEKGTMLECFKCLVISGAKPLFGLLILFLCLIARKAIS